MTAAAELRAAAGRLRELAEAATDGPWRSHDTHLTFGGHTATVMTERPNLNDTELLAWVPTMSHEPWDEARNAWHNAGFIAAMHPGVALALAAWLEPVAQRVERIPSHAEDEPEARAALAVARALGAA